MVCEKKIDHKSIVCTVCVDQKKSKLCFGQVSCGDAFVEFALYIYGVAYGVPTTSNEKT